MAQEDVFKKLVSHCKEYGFVFPSSDIYDGLGAVYDYGQMGVELKNNIKQYWWQSMVLLHENIVGIDSAIFMHPTIWKASGHVDAFNDPLIDNRDSKKRYRADVLIEDQLAKYDEKINKEVAKAAKRFGDAFDEAQFRSTNGRVLEHQAKRDALHERFSKALNDNDLDELRQIIIDEEIEEINNHLAHIVEYTIDWYQMLKDKYGKQYPRRTELRNFDTIEAAKVVEANEKLYINREEGFIGTALKKDEFIANCSDIDDVIIFYKDGKYKVVRVTDKMFVGKNVLYVNIFKKNDKRTIYNVVYRDGKEGFHYIKRFNITSITRDREYDVTQGTPGSRIVYFTANPNGEAEVIKITLKPNPRIKKIIYEKDFSDINIKGRQSMGNILSKYEVHKIALKQRGGSTLGGRKVWFDRDVLRLNYDGRGEYLGEFQSDELILIVHENGEFYTSNFDLNNHYDPGIHIIEKFDANKVWSAALFDADQGYPYLKRFTFESTSRRLNYLGENKESRSILLTCVAYPRIQVIFGGHDSFRDPLEIDVDEFIGIKSFKAKGKRISTYNIEQINELEPLRFPEPSKEEDGAEEGTDENEETAEIEDPDHGKSETDIIDEITGQMKLF
jgi:topoisomerase IV subunit A